MYEQFYPARRFSLHLASGYRDWKLTPEQRGKVQKVFRNTVMEFMERNWQCKMETDAASCILYVDTAASASARADFREACDLARKAVVQMNKGNKK